MSWRWFVSRQCFTIRWNIIPVWCNPQRISARPGFICVSPRYGGDAPDPKSCPNTAEAARAARTHVCILRDASVRTCARSLALHLLIRTGSVNTINFVAQNDGHATRRMYNASDIDAQRQRERPEKGRNKKSLTRNEKNQIYLWCRENKIFHGVIYLCTFFYVRLPATRVAYGCCVTRLRNIRRTIMKNCLPAWSNGKKCIMMKVHH